MNSNERIGKMSNRIKSGEWFSPKRAIICGFYIFISFVLNTNASDVNQQSTRIVGGIEAQPGAWPWQASIQDPLFGHFCGGSLIAPEWVVTAAHCVDTASPESVKVVLGRHDLRTANGEEHAISQIIIHPDWDPGTNNNDIALLHLVSPSTQEPVNLVGSGDEPLYSPGVTATVTGWGALSEGGLNSDVLQQVQVDIVTNTIANTAEAYNGEVSENMIAAGFIEGGKDSCQGDSGGPLLVPNSDNTGWKLGGIVSWGHGCARPNLYGIYTRISNYSSWVDESIEESIDTKLQNGVPLTNLSGRQDSEIFFSIDVPADADNLEVVLSDGLGDADLYIQFGAQPSLESYSCRPWLYGNDETCTFPTPKAGIYHVMLHGYREYSGTSILAVYDVDTSVVLESGIPITDLTENQNSEVFFSIDVPADVDNLEVVLSDGLGDADLYVQFGAQPSLESYDCRPWLYGNDETCTFPTPGAGTYYIMIKGYSNYAGVSIVANYDEILGRGLKNGGPIVDLSGSAGSQELYTFDVPENASDLEIAIAGGMGDADLYVQFGSQPSLENYECAPYLPGNEEFCFFAVPEAGTYYILIHGYQGYSGVSLMYSHE